MIKSGSVWFQGLSESEVFVIGDDLTLWHEVGPWGGLPPRRSAVDGTVVAFQALDSAHVYVLGGDGKLWLETGPWGPVPSERVQVDAHVASFQALSVDEVFVVGLGGNLWYEVGPWGTVPPRRDQVDANTFTFDALDSSHVYVLGSDSRLWLEAGPWGKVPPARQQIDANVSPLKLPPSPASLQIALQVPSIELGGAHGNATLTVQSDGSCAFSGYFNASNSWDGLAGYHIGIVWVLRDSAGNGYAFSAAGSFGPESSWSFNETTTSQVIAERWADLSAAYTYSWDATSNIDLSQVVADLENLFNTVLSDFEKGLEVAGQVLQIVGPLVALALG